jgi:hypothetical protein
MKKTLLALAGLNLFVSFGQVVTNDFENITLSVESFDNGSSGSGGFTADHSFYENTYDPTWGSWTGFSVSNVTDNTTAGWANQYSAFPGFGANNSANYAIYYPAGGIDLTTVSTGVYLDSVKITNATYAAISMRDGDAYGKQFGSVNDANGVVDGTNGEDYFRIWIMAEYVGGELDSMEFYLADYRFADPNDDYIIDEWVNVDLSAFDQPVARLDFRFESSDVGQFGINTPTYFALDDLNFTSTADIQELSFEMNVFPNPAVNVLNVAAQGVTGEMTITDVKGNLISNESFQNGLSLDVSNLEAGVYYVSLIDQSGNIARTSFVK